MKFLPLLETLLAERGVTEETRGEFLNPDFQSLHDPLLLPDMEKARDRVVSAMKKGERIMIFSDYDADGIPGAVVLADFFRRAKYPNVTFYIPHRHDEGFGLNCEAIDKAKGEDAKLLITIDCGTADLEEAKYAKKQGIDLIVTDHHQEKDKLPVAVAVVNPHRKNSTYPFKDLCGAAVAYKLVQAILLKERFDIKEGHEKWSLDMVGIATLSDMVPLVGENRIFAHFGLNVLRKSPRPGLAALLKRLAINQTFLTEDDIAFMITPRINAASRMGVPMDAFRLLSTDSLVEADRLSLHLEKINNERKGIVAALVKDAKGHLEKRGELPSVLVIGNPEWKPALLGLVANTLVEEYMRPAFVWGRDGDGVIKGSCRSYNGYSLIEIMNGACGFIEYGGHTGAGGFSVGNDDIHTLEEKLSASLEKLEKKLEEVQEKFGSEIEVGDINEDLWGIVSQLAPFGVGNPKPVFRIPADISSVRQFGKTKDHLEILLRSPKGRDVKAISFFSDEDSFSTPLKPDMKAEVHAHLEKSYFMNRPELRLRIVDILKT
ncbi:MAG: recJ [Parcubacteria group bacterium]|nr:recJ [Parcubacteria group bacterium]